MVTQQYNFCFHSGILTRHMDLESERLKIGPIDTENSWKLVRLFLLRGTQVHRTRVPFIVHSLKWLALVSRCVISMGLSTWVSRTRVPCEVPESTALEYGLGFFFFFFCKKVESSRLVLEFLGLEYYVKYSTPLNSGMARVFLEKNVDQADWYSCFYNLSIMWSTQVH